MPLNNKQIIHQGAFLYDKLNKEISIIEFAYNILIEYGKLSTEKASEYVSKYKTSIGNNLKKQNDELQSRGLTIIGNITTGDRISWNTNSPSSQLIWKMRPVLLKIIDALTDDKFEAVCCVCLNLMGGNAWKTKSKGDGNVDFYGIASTSMNNHIFGKGSKFRIVGQCKNYGHQENVTSFESFIHAMSNVRHLSSRVVAEMPNEFSRENGPISGWYICKDGFQTGVLEEARKHGIVVSDKYDLVEILANLQMKGISSLETLCRLNILRCIRTYLS